LIAGQKKSKKKKKKLNPKNGKAGMFQNNNHVQKQAKRNVMNNFNKRPMKKVTSNHRISTFIEARQVNTSFFIVNL
jgi:hypothetical protein